MNKIFEAINNLHIALEKELSRSNMNIHLEPDAFYRLYNLYYDKDILFPNNQLSEFIVFKINTPIGIIQIIKDENLK